jgi:hypothetical protein
LAPPGACGGGRRGPLELKELDESLLARALEHDSPLLLFRLACEYLISARVIRPGPVTVVERVAHAREHARRETFDRLADQFGWKQPGQRRQGCPVGPVRLRPCDLTPEHRDLMTEHHDLRVLGRLAPAGQHQPAKDPDRNQVEQTKSHEP